MYKATHGLASFPLSPLQQHKIRRFHASPLLLLLCPQLFLAVGYGWVVWSDAGHSGVEKKKITSPSPPNGKLPGNGRFLSSSSSSSPPKILVFGTTTLFTTHYSSFLPQGLDIRSKSRNATPFVALLLLLLLSPL